MAIGDIGSEQDTLEFDPTAADWISTCHLTGDVYVSAYAGPDNDGWICTYLCDPSGIMPANIIDSYEFDGTKADFVSIIKAADGIVLIAYSKVDLHGWLISIAIAADGTITKSIQDDLEFDSTLGYPGNFLKIADGIFSLVYCGPGGDGWVKTFSCDATGQIGAAKIDELEFDIATGAEPWHCQVWDTIYAVAYRGPGDDGWVKTFSISETGTISGTTLGQLEFDMTYAYYCTICKAFNAFCAIAYQGPGDDGWIKIVEINSSGAITDPVKDSYEHDISQGYAPFILPIGEGYLVLAFGHTAGGVILKTFLCDADGKLNNTTLDTFQFTADAGSIPEILPVSGNIYLIPNRGAQGDGYLHTVDIITPGVSVTPQQIMMMGIG